VNAITTLSQQQWGPGRKYEDVYSRNKIAGIKNIKKSLGINLIKHV